MAVDVTDAYPLHQHQLWPTDSDARGDTFVMPWHTRHLCTAANTSTSMLGAVLGDGCGSFWAGDGRNSVGAGEGYGSDENFGSAALHVQTTAMLGLEHGFDLLSVAPIMRRADGKGIALLGEVGKVVSVSGNRFSAVTLDETGVAVRTSVKGTPHEIVELVWYTFSAREDAQGMRHLQRMELNSTGEGMLELPFL
jgi:hypothetical protein